MKENVYNLLRISEEDSAVSLCGGIWPGAIDPPNFLIGRYPTEDSDNFKVSISDDGNQIYGDKYIKFENIIKDGTYDKNNFLYFRINLSDSGLTPGNTYTVFASVKGRDISENKFNPKEFKLISNFCQSFSNDNQIRIGETSLDKVLKAEDIKDNKFDQKIISLSFTVPSYEELGLNTSMNLYFYVNNGGIFTFDGFGMVQGSYSDNPALLKEISDNIFDKNKAEENKLGSFKEITLLQIEAYNNYAKEKYDLPDLQTRYDDFVKKVQSSSTIRQVKEARAAFVSYASTTKPQEAYECKKVSKNEREAVALNEYEWHNLRFTNILPGSFFASYPPQSLCFGIDTYEGSSKGVELIEGVDFEVDYEKGLIRRLPGTIIPDAGATGYYEYEDKSFILGETQGSPSFRGYTFFVSYEFDNSKCKSYEEVLSEINKNNRTCKPKKLLKKLKKDDDLTYLVIGDSINTGAEAIEGYTFFDLFADYLTTEYGNKVTVVNYAVGGETSHGGSNQILRAIDDKINPDIITIGFGMNDQNGEGVPMEDFRENYDNMFKIIKSNWPDAEVILLTSIPACPIWNLTSGRDVEYSAEIVNIARKNHCAVADCNTLSHKEVEAGKHYAEVVTTGINHPGAYGHRLYFYAIRSLFEIKGLNAFKIVLISAAAAAAAGAACIFVSKNKKKKGSTNEKN